MLFRVNNNANDTEQEIINKFGEIAVEIKSDLLYDLEVGVFIVDIKNEEDFNSLLDYVSLSETADLLEYPSTYPTKRIVIEEFFANNVLVQEEDDILGTFDKLKKDFENVLEQLNKYENGEVHYAGKVF